MKVVEIDDAQFLVLAACKTGRHNVFIFDASWLWRSAEYESKIKSMMSEVASSASASAADADAIIYRVISRGSDEVEDTLFDRFGVSSFPLLLTPSHEGWTTFDSSVSSTDSEQNSLAEQQYVDLPLLFSDANGVGTLFVGGDRSSVGKSSSCLGLLAALIDSGVSASDIGYIKPITQCEAEQPVTIYCNAHGIECVGIGPVVFFKGFTRAFLAGDTETSEELLQKACSAVKSMRSRRKFVLVDGVGYPAVGSICGISNAHVAAKLNAPAILIGKSGVGDAVDSHNLNSVFFQYHGVNVLGGIFNKIALEGFYNLESVREAVGSYFNQRNDNQKAYGFVPIINMGDEGKSLQDKITKTFAEHVDIKSLIWDLYMHTLQKNENPFENIFSSATTDQAQEYSHVQEIESSTKMKINLVRKQPGGSNIDYTSSAKKTKINPSTTISRVPEQEASKASKRSREEIENLAKSQGAKGG